MMGSVNQPDAPADIVKQLEEAIRSGETANAVKLAKLLVDGRVPLIVSTAEASGGRTALEENEPEISIKVFIEDKTESGGFERLSVHPGMNIRQLKLLIHNQYGCSVEDQRWVIGSCIARDCDILRDLGVIYNDTEVFLYLVSRDSTSQSQRDRMIHRKQHEAKATPPHSLNVNHDVREEITRPATSSSLSLPTNINMQAETWSCAACTCSNPVGAMSCSVCDTENPQYINMLEENAARPTPGDIDGWICEVCTYINSPTRPGCEMCSAEPPREYRYQTVVPASRTRNNVTAENLQQNPCWRCPDCSYENIPTRPGCQICGGSRPEDYVVPGDYRPTPAERERMETERRNEELIQQLCLVSANQNIQQLTRELVEGLDSHPEKMLQVIQALDDNQQKLIYKLVEDYQKEQRR